MKKIVVLLIGLCSSAVHADDAVTVSDMSQLSWQLDSSGKVYFRNLNEFNSEFIGCCYNHYIDTTTADGKAKWSAVLSYIAMDKPMILFVASKNQPGPVTFVMN